MKAKVMKVGQEVRTTQDAKSGLAMAASRRPQWGVMGKVVDVSGAPTLYEVEHKDGSHAWYEPVEVMRVLC